MKSSRGRLGQAQPGIWCKWSVCPKAHFLDPHPQCSKIKNLSATAKSPYNSLIVMNVPSGGRWPRVTYKMATRFIPATDLSDSLIASIFLSSWYCRGEQRKMSNSDSTEMSFLTAGRTVSESNMTSLQRHCILAPYMSVVVGGITWTVKSSPSFLLEDWVIIPRKPLHFPLM